MEKARIAAGLSVFGSPCRTERAPCSHHDARQPAHYAHPAWAHTGIVLDPNIGLLATSPGEGRIEHRMGFVSGLTLAACDQTESRTKSYTDLADAVRRYCHPFGIRQKNEELFKRTGANQQFEFPVGEEDMRAQWLTP